MDLLVYQYYLSHITGLHGFHIYTIVGRTLKRKGLSDRWRSDIHTKFNENTSVDYRLLRGTGTDERVHLVQYCYHSS
jgi:hypothetical protein